MRQFNVIHIKQHSLLGTFYFSIHYTRYLEKTKDLILTLEVDNLCQMHCYVDAAHMLHHDLKGHTGSYTSFGGGAVKFLQQLRN